METSFNTFGWSTKHEVLATYPFKFTIFLKSSILPMVFLTAAKQSIKENLAHFFAFSNETLSPTRPLYINFPFNFATCPETKVKLPPALASGF